MKIFIALSAIIVLAAAQSTTGGYHFGYNDGQSSRQEEQSADGVVRGAYSFIDANGAVQTVRYTADSVNGYQIVPDVAVNPSPAFDVNGVPLPVVDTPEVAAAKREHFEAVRLAGGQSLLQLTQILPGAGSSGAFDINGIPLQVVDTPEVSAAKQQHFEAIRVAGGLSVPQFVPTLPGSNLIAGRFDSNGLPLAVTDTPEVAAAKYAHYQVYRQL